MYRLVLLRWRYFQAEKPQLPELNRSKNLQEFTSNGLVPGLRSTELSDKITAMSNYLTAKEVADMCKFTRSAIYKLVRRGDLKGYKLGGKVLFLPEDVKAALKSTSPSKIPA